MSQTPEYILEKIKTAAIDRSEELDLSASGDKQADLLTTVPKELLDLPWLKVLIIRWHRLKSLPKWITRLQNLTMLDLALNEITALPESITRLYNLCSAPHLASVF